MIALVSEYRGVGRGLLGADYLFMAERVYLLLDLVASCRIYASYFSINAHFLLMHSLHFSWQLIRLFLNIIFVFDYHTIFYNEHN